ncbi:MAG TPA: hypothetical protein DCD97_00315 [Firmicutes bacterium]|nr:hypothetical protein [Bacillota bacterium]
MDFNGGERPEYTREVLSGAYIIVELVTGTRLVELRAYDNGFYGRRLMTNQIITNKSLGFIAGAFII